MQYDEGHQRHHRRRQVYVWVVSIIDEDAKASAWVPKSRHEIFKPKLQKSWNVHLIQTTRELRYRGRSQKLELSSYANTAEVVNIL
jgi:hypothetical protein